MHVRPCGYSPPAVVSEEEEEEEEEEEAVFIRGVNTKRRRRRLSLLVKIEGDPLNTQHAQHRSVQATGR